MAFIEDQNIKNIINPARASAETGSYRISQIERFMRDVDKENKLNLFPKFQRELVWDVHHQTKFMESVLRGLVPHSINLIRFNDPSLGNIQGNFIAPDSDLPNETQCIDGLQRFYSMLCYMRGELSPFGLSRDQIEATYYGVHAQNLCFTVAWYDFQYESDLIEFYRDLNWGGIPHSSEEFTRICKLIEVAKQRRGITNA